MMQLQKEEALGGDDDLNGQMIILEELGLLQGIKEFMNLKIVKSRSFIQVD